jgi:hypothetical protein
MEGNYTMKSNAIKELIEFFNRVTPQFKIEK